MLMSFLELFKEEYDRAKAYNLALKQEVLKRQTDERNAMGLKALQLCAEAENGANKRMGGPEFSKVYPTRYNLDWRRHWIEVYHQEKRRLMRSGVVS